MRIGRKLDLGVDQLTELHRGSLFHDIGKIAVPGAILGTVIIFSIMNGLVLLGASTAVQQISLGLVLVAAVGFDVTYTKYYRNRG